MYLLFFPIFFSLVNGQTFEVELLRNEYLMYYKVISFKFKIGDMDFESYLFPNLEDLVVIDSECGKPMSGCSKYCNDNHFHHYCNPLCGISEQTKIFVCGAEIEGADLYDHKNSSTYRPITPTNNTWIRYIGVPRQLYGLYGLEQFVIPTVNDTEKLIDTNFKFVRGLLLNSKLGFEQNVFFGIGPGKDGTVKRLYENGIIQAPLLSISLNANKMIFGAEANEYCENDWHYYPTATKNAWSLMVETIGITSLADFKNVKIAIVPNEMWYIQVPLEIGKQLYKNGILLDYPKSEVDPETLRYNCSVDLTFEFHFKDHTFIMDQLFTIIDGDCIALIIAFSDEPNEYTDDIQLKMGTPFFDSFCHTFNYADNTLGLANIKK